MSVNSARGTGGGVCSSGRDELGRPFRAHDSIGRHRLAFPRALPWAAMGCDGLPLWGEERMLYTVPQLHQIELGRPFRAHDSIGRHRLALLPRALPWATIGGPFGAEESDIKVLVFINIKSLPFRELCRPFRALGSGARLSCLFEAKNECLAQFAINTKRAPHPHRIPHLGHGALAWPLQLPSAAWSPSNTKS